MQASFPKVNLLSNGSTEVREKLFILNCTILKTGRGRKFKFGENAFWIYSNILVSIENFDLKALLI